MSRESEILKLKYYIRYLEQQIEDLNRRLVDARMELAMKQNE